MEHVQGLLKVLWWYF